MSNDIVFSGHQPNFLPYMGVIYKMFQSDVFVLDNDVQYSRTGLHNANFIKLNGEKHRITIPVSYEHGDPINWVRICYGKDWAGKMLKTIQMAYGRTPYFKEGYDLLERHFDARYEYLEDLNIALLKEIAEKFNLHCNLFIASKDLPTSQKKNDRNIFQCKALGANVYYSGVGGREYNDEEAYRKNGIRIVYSDFQPTEYKQVGAKFIPNLSVIDYIFNQGFSLPKEWKATR